MCWSKNVEVLKVQKENFSYQKRFFSPWPQVQAEDGGWQGQALITTTRVLHSLVSTVVDRWMYVDKVQTEGTAGEEWDQKIIKGGSDKSIQRINVCTNID